MSRAAKLADKIKGSLSVEITFARNGQHYRTYLDDEHTALLVDGLNALSNGHPPRRWRHKKRGSTYVEIGRAELQASRDVIEGMTFVVYRSEHDGKLWVRQEDEFEDGRFEPAPSQEATKQ